MNATATATETPRSEAAQLNVEGRRCVSRTVAMDIVAFGDILAVTLGAQLPSWIYYKIGGIENNALVLLQAGLVGGYFAFLWLRHAGMYDTDRMHDLPYNPLQLLTAIALGILIVLGLSMPMVEMLWHVAFWFLGWLITSFTLILFSRGIAHAVLARMAAKGRFDKAVAVFGAGAISQRVHSYLKTKESGIRFIGAYDDRTDGDRINPEGLELAGRLDDLLAVAFAGKVDDIVIALPNTADSRIDDILRKLEHAPCDVHIVSHLATDLVPAGQQHRVSQMGAVGLVDVKCKPLSGWAPLVKRVEDIIVASVALTISIPILVAAMIAIKLDSKGSVLYRQRRRGLNRQVFDVLKLRTLRVSDTDHEVRQVTTDDDRVTRVGRFLRRTSIDELPQLWNVLRGDMSIVGPRPHALVHDDQFGTMLEDYASRHQVKPGITGLAQVNGFRGETRTDDLIKGRVAHDMAYVKSWSLWLDLKIIARTLIIVVSGRNAY